MRKTHKHQETGMAIGMCLGVSIGLTLGETLFGQMSLGMCFGMCIGMLLGMAVGMYRDEAINKQLEEQAYTVKEITEKDDGGYSIVIVDKNGEEKMVNIDAGDMEAEEFAVGDYVFLDDEGNLEQAFDKEAEDEEDTEDDEETDADTANTENEISKAEKDGEQADSKE